MKKTTLLIACTLFATLLFANPSERLIRTFNESYPGAENVKWHEDDAGYLVSFTQMGVVTKVNYDKDGVFQNSLRYYDESKLPLNVVLALKKKYEGKTVFGVTELNSEEGITYHIRMQDDKFWYTVKATPDGLVSTKEKLKKG